MKKKALVTGIRGQDGAYLAELLLSKGYEVYGADRRSSEGSWRLKELGVEKEVKIEYMELLELSNIMKVIGRTQPDEIYNLGAQSFVAASFDQPIYTTEVNALGPLKILEAMRMLKSKAKFYQASTSEMYGSVQSWPQNEETPFHPINPYAVTKLYAHWMTVNYRKAYKIFACSGVLFNHESPLRGAEFVTRKITTGVARIRHGLQDKIVLGNLESKRDWGFAKEYVEGMWRMLQQDTPDTYVLATGETHTVKEFVDEAFKAADFNIEWRGENLECKAIDKKTGRVVVEISPDFYRPTEVDVLIADNKKAIEKLGWRPTTKFKDLVALMVRADLKRASDAPTH